MLRLQRAGIAIHGVTDENFSAADTIESFRDSLPQPRWRLLLTVFIAIAILLVQPALELMTKVVSGLFADVRSDVRWLGQSKEIFAKLTSYIANLSL
jgi:hypothetical protein